MTSKPRLAVGAAIVASMLALSACGASNSGSGSGDEGSAGAPQGDPKWLQCTPGENSASIDDLASDSDKEITIGAFNGWDESFAVAHLTKYVLEDAGYTVDIQAFDAAPGYTAVANGDIDFIVDAWLPITHADYLEEYGDKLDAQGCWYDNAKLTIAVNEDSPAQSIGDLKDMGDEYGGVLYGIESGAGLTKTTEESAIPTYGLDDLEFRVSSTPAMLAQLKKSTEAGENVAVTLWRPHWAYDAFPVRDLEDPEGAMGDAEILYTFSTKGFADDNPAVAQLMNNFVFDDDHLASLENVMFSEDNFNGEDNDAAVAQWVSENPDFVEQWTSGQLAAA